MNEFFAFQPSEKLHPSEMRRLLGYFGLPVGRFIADYPPNWANILLSHDWTERSNRPARAANRSEETRGVGRLHMARWNAALAKTDMAMVHIARD